MGQLQDTMYKDTPMVIRDVTAAQFAAQRANTDKRIIYRVGGVLYTPQPSGGHLPLTQLATDANGNVIGDGKLPITLAKANGSIAAPLATITGVTAGAFVLPAGDPIIPAGLLVPGVSKLRIEAHIRRSSAVATANAIVRIGTTPASSTYALNATLAATNTLDFRVFVDAYPIANDAFMRSNNAAVNTNTTNTYSEGQSALVDFMANQTIQFRIESANVGDTFILTSYHITVYP